MPYPALPLSLSLLRISLAVLYSKQTGESRCSKCNHGKLDFWGEPFQAAQQGSSYASTTHRKVWLKLAVSSILLYVFAIKFCYILQISWLAYL